MHSIIENIGLQFGPGAAWLATSTMIFLRYAILAALVFFIVYKWKRREWFVRKIQQKFPKTAQVKQEIVYSLFTSLIFGGMALVIFFLRKMGYGQLYFEVAEHGWAYLGFSFAFLVFAHDTYFYWVHRAMHHPRLYRRFHLVHHKSTNPTPFASFSFHPLESVLEFAIIPVLTLLIPVHAVVFFLFTLWSILFNVLGHTGYEIDPKGFTRHWFFKWLNTPTHHNMHHQLAHHNYGLYFNFWDRIMGTNHPDYDRTFEEVVNRTEKPDGKPPVPFRKPINKAAAVVAFLLFSLSASGQMSVDDLKKGHYGSPESRTTQMDSMMREGLQLRQDQMTKVHEINLRYAQRTEEEVVNQDLGNWPRYRRLTKIQQDKDHELKSILDSEQFEKYVVRRDKMFWEGITAFFF